METKPLLVAIDGRAGAGKTTLANKINTVYDASIIRMDHFFVPHWLRDTKAKRELDVNVDYQRFAEEVVTGLSLFSAVDGVASFSYRIYDCAFGDYCGEQKVESKALIIIEGAYALLPLWQEIYDLKLFFDIDAEEQKRRIIARNGTHGYHDFQTKWIPMEEEYLTSYDIASQSDLVFMKEDEGMEAVKRLLLANSLAYSYNPIRV
ncbi:MAG: hypothetical protein LBC96_01910 [Lachnospiraceae bacterium]|jgi:uridine kinase|nr:hypothetical protein [Lachnospiraceae bacterium]